jgi:hypothetical protein
MASDRSGLRSANPAFGFVAAALVFALSTPAIAQSTADKEQAKLLVIEGRKLRDAQKDHVGALRRFEAAYDLVKTPIIGLDLAREQAALGQLVEAYGTCDEIGRLPTKDTESAESKDARASAATLGADLKIRIPKLSIALKAGPRADAPKPVVRLDGAELAPASLLVPRPVNPGTHTLVVSVEGATPTSQSVTVAERESREIVLEVPVVVKIEPAIAPSKTPEPTTAPPPITPPPIASAPIAPAVPPTEVTSRGSGQRVAGLVIGSAGIVGIGVGGLLALGAKSKAGGASCDANDVCATSADVDQRHAAVKQANVATIVVGVGAALAVGGAVLWLTAPSGGNDTTSTAKTGVTALGVGPTGFVMMGRF